MAKPADDPKDILDFKFRSMRKIRLQDESEAGELSKDPTQKLAVANSFGKLFAGKKKQECSFKLSCH